MTNLVQFSVEIIESLEISQIFWKIIWIVHFVYDKLNHGKEIHGKNIIFLINILNRYIPAGLLVSCNKKYNILLGLNQRRHYTCQVTWHLLYHVNCDHTVSNYWGSNYLVRYSTQSQYPDINAYN